jgi:hypothetical protein
MLTDEQELTLRKGLTQAKALWRAIELSAERAAQQAVADPAFTQSLAQEMEREADRNRATSELALKEAIRHLKSCIKVERMQYTDEEWDALHGGKLFRGVQRDVLGEHFAVTSEEVDRLEDMILARDVNGVSDWFRSRLDDEVGILAVLTYKEQDGAP